MVSLFCMILYGVLLFFIQILKQLKMSIKAFKIHHSYLERGADIITTASYQASIGGFQKHLGLNLDESKRLIKLSVELAENAKQDHLKESISECKEILIAGSVGPYGAALADGSEYSGKYCDKVSHEELIKWHLPRIQCLLDAGADLLAFETMPAVKEAEALMKLLHDFPHAKAWLSFSSQSMHYTCNGEDISSAALNCIKRAPSGQLVAVGVNCCPAEFAGSLLKDIASVSDGFPLIVYPNSGEKWDHQQGWTGEKVKPNHTYLDTWVNASAKIIGGCCRTTPEDIFHIHQFACEKNKENVVA
ncbi:homocysteine S-methyltransferase YbgG-like isoform X2 [Stegodyphus dumicola]|uniref:homocysteine S-methyltransferase YbgG-like isoform X2 n=1 Tax=Stegodyphus dumicola TaxID=202533 RepID=UPI0015A8080B|nr:homocysteine S-methyltransferase YbgG-like isoform X2 [Stegodyphus dumicola]XP_035208329.1 homocysteine S-methyltransferase YbgG-like isoform X2 [Stegodyphus dumicola]